MTRFNVPPNLVLDPLTEADLAPYIALFCAEYPRMQATFSWPGDLATPAGQDRWLRAQMAAMHADPFAPIWVLRIDGSLAGGLWSHGVNHYNASTSFGGWIAQPWEGQGHMRRACTAMLDWAFGTAGLHRIEAMAAVANRRSLRLIEALGFTFEGLARDYGRTPHGWEDVRRYALISTDPRPTLLIPSQSPTSL